ncbi:hypothetical protein ACFFRR_002831 [Megaselia abdita]
MSVKTLFLLTLISGSLALQGYKILEISPRTTEEQNTVESLISTYDFLKFSRVGPSQVLVSHDQFAQLLQTLVNISSEVINDNVLRDVVKDNNDNEIFCISARMGTDCYRSHLEINNYIEDLQRRFPHRVFVKQVGYTFENRALKTITVTNGDGRKNKPVIFVDAGMHAREWISPATGIYVIQQLVEHFDNNKNLLKDHDWVVMPMINADGYEFTRSDPSNRFWRKNRKSYSEKCDGVDLNRNFDYMYGVSGTSSDPCADTFKGPGPFSEPESTVVRDVLLSLKGRTSFYLSLHSYGPYFLHPWSYAKVDAPNDEELSDVARAGYEAILAYGGRVYKYGNTAKLTYAAAGESSDYAYAVAGARISVTMELPSGGKKGFDPPPQDIKPYVEEAWVGIEAMAMRVIEKY